MSKFIGTLLSVVLLAVANLASAEQSQTADEVSLPNSRIVIAACYVNKSAFSRDETVTHDTWLDADRAKADAFFREFAMRVVAAGFYIDTVDLAGCDMKNEGNEGLALVRFSVFPEFFDHVVAAEVAVKAVGQKTPRGVGGKFLNGLRGVGVDTAAEELSSAVVTKITEVD